MSKLEIAVAIYMKGLAPICVLETLTDFHITFVDGDEITVAKDVWERECLKFVV